MNISYLWKIKVKNLQFFSLDKFINAQQVKEIWRVSDEHERFIYNKLLININAEEEWKNLLKHFESFQINAENEFYTDLGFFLMICISNDANDASTMEC